MILTVSPEQAGRRLDTVLADAASLSRSGAAKLIEAGAVTVNGASSSKNYLLRAGDELCLTLPEPREICAQPEDIPLNIVYEDDALLVINKPSGMVVHPAPGNPDGTLVNALLHHCKGQLSGINGELRPGIVHRIDKDTSGLLVVAKTDLAHRRLAEQLEGHHITREYRAIVCGGLRSDSGTVDAPIGRHPVDRKKMAVLTDGNHSARDAVTHYTVLERFGGFTYLQLALETGRTHQIRVHMSYIGHPLMGDAQYGGCRTPFEREHARLLHGQVLHARRLSFVHPMSGEPVSFECPMPDDFERLLSILRSRQ